MIVLVLYLDTFKETVQVWEKTLGFLKQKEKILSTQYDHLPLDAKTLEFLHPDRATTLTPEYKPLEIMEKIGSILGENLLLASYTWQDIGSTVTFEIHLYAQHQEKSAAHFQAFLTRLNQTFPSSTVDVLSPHKKESPALSLRITLVQGKN